MSPIDTAASGLRASQMRLNVSASNIANIESVGPIAPVQPMSASANTAAYQPGIVRQVATPDGGVSATYAKRQPATVARYDPSSAAADADGMVAAPTVSETDEAVEQVMAADAFRANAAVLRAAGDMERDIIDRIA